MSCIIIPEGEYTFTPGASGVGKVTLLNRHIKYHQIKSIAKVEVDVNDNKQLIYNGIGSAKGQTSTVINGNDTDIFLEFDTSSGFTASDKLVVVIDLESKVVLDEQGTVIINGGSISSLVVNTNDFESLSLRVVSDVDVIIKYHRYPELNAQGVDDPLIFNLDALKSNQGNTPKKFRGSLNNDTDRSWAIEISNVSGGNATINATIVASTEKVSGAVIPLDFPITTTTSLLHTASILKGNLDNASLESTGITDEVRLLPNGGLKVGLPSDIVFEYDIPPASSLPSGSIPVIDPILNVDANLIDSGWFPVRAYPGGQALNILTDQSCKVFLLNAKDDQGDKMVGDAFPFLTPQANDAVPFSAKYFDGYSRIVVVNDSGSNITEARILAEGLQAPVPGIWTRLDQPIFDAFPAHLTQAVIKGKDDVTGIYQAPNTHSSINGISLITAQGHKPSDIFGRTHVEFSDTAESALALPASTTAYTIPNIGSENFEMYGLEITAVNTSLALSGEVIIRDGGPTGTVKRRYLIGSATNQNNSQVFLSRSFVEPLIFSTDVYVEISNVVGVGVATLTINAEGFLNNI